MKRPLQSRLDLLRPFVKRRVQGRQAEQKRQYDAHSRLREFDVGQAVLVRNLREGLKWVDGTIVEQTGPVSYRVQVSDQIWRHHTDQMLDCSGTNSNETDTPDPDVVCSQLPSPADTEPVPQPLNDSVPLSNTE